MILSALRQSEILQNRILSNSIVCSNSDFNASLTITKTLILHAALIFQQLPTETLEHSPNINPQHRLLQVLPQEFDRKKYLEIAKTLNIPDQTVKKQIERYL